MAMSKKKAVAVVAGLGALLIGGVAMAATKKKPQPSGEGEEEVDEEATAVVTPDASQDVASADNAPPTEDDITVEVPSEDEDDDTPAAEVVVSQEEVERMASEPETTAQKAEAAGVPNPANPAGTAKPMSKAHEVPVPTQEAKQVVQKVTQEAEGIAATTGKTTEQVIAEKVASAADVQPDPVAVEETKPENDPNGTIALARKMLAREELPNWKSDLKSSVKAWQGRVGLTADGLFGPGSAARMAEEVGLLPLVRYWPKSITTKKEAEAVYDSRIGRVIKALEMKGDITEPHRNALLASMNREVAVTMGTANPPPQDTADFAQDVVDAIGVAAEEETKREMGVA